MYNSNTLFRGLLTVVPGFLFSSLVRQFNTDRYCRHFTTYAQFTVLLFAQIRGKDSLRDIEIAFNQRHKLFYHLGITIPNGVKRSTMADANSRITYRFYQQLFFKLLERFSRNLVEPNKFRFTNDLYALDASFVEMVINMFPWAKFRATKGAIKLHVAFNIRKQIPEVVVITTGKVGDRMGFTDFSAPKWFNSIWVFDKGYWDIYRFNLFTRKGIYFVTRLKRRVCFEVVKTHPSKSRGVRSDQVIRLSSKRSLETYPGELRLVRYIDDETGIDYEFVTNIFHLAAGTIALIYKNRWQVELFFKWIKQNLVIKTFFGTTQNAVFSQVWVALIYYLILSYIKSQTKFSGSIRNLAEIIDERLFDDCTILDVLNPISQTSGGSPEDLQLDLFQG